MSRGGPVFIRHTTLVLFSTIAPTSAGLWDIDIDHGPAPAPEDGPPFSANAIRDRTLLPYQIIAIIGAYVATVCVLSTLLLTTGKKLRRRAQAMADRPKEMIKPMSKSFDSVPASPRHFSRFVSKLRGKASVTSSIISGPSRVGSPGMSSVLSIDPVVVEQNRQQAQEDLSRLYGAVYEFDDQKSQTDVMAIEMKLAHPPRFGRSRPPPRLVTSPDSYQIQRENPYLQSPASKSASVYAIYPPVQSQNGERHLPQQHSQSGSGTGQMLQTENISNSEAAPGLIRTSFKDMKIGVPIQSLRHNNNSDGVRTPLSPRFLVDSAVSPQPSTGRNLDSPIYSEGRDGGEEWDEIRALPTSAPQSVPSNETDGAGFPPYAATTASPKRSATNIHGTLPFRRNDYARSSSQASSTATRSDVNIAAPLSPHLLSPAIRSPSIRERVIEVGVGNRLSGPYTGCATPYSPYMPYTPVIPITPHLETRAERKQRQREEKATRGAITEEDGVADDQELWGSGY